MSLSNIYFEAMRAIVTANEFAYNLALALRVAMPFFMVPAGESFCRLSPDL